MPTAFNRCTYAVKLPFACRKAPFALIAATAENENDCKDNYPGAVVVKKVAKAIVVHSYVPPWSSFGRICPLSNIL